MSTVVIMPGGFHPFHAGHLALYQSAQRAFPDAEVFVAATNDTSARPFPFAVKEKLAKLAGVEPGHFVQVKSPFQATEITAKFDPAKDHLIFVRSEKDAGLPPQPGRVKKDGSPGYLQPLLGATKLEPFAKHAYMAYLPTVEFGPGMTSATEIRTAWPQLDERRKTALVMSLYPRTQGNVKLAQTVVALLDAAIGTAATESTNPMTANTAGAGAGMTSVMSRRYNQPPMEGQGWAATLEENPDYIEEKWSAKYKRSINCANPRGFSQRAHCAGRRKNEDVAEAFGPLPRDDQRIRLGRHTVDIERVGLDKNYISFAWHDSKGQEHYEEVAVGDLGSYDDLIKRIKQEISYQERKYTDQGVAEGRVQYKEIEFVCANPDFCDATDPVKQQQLYKALTKIPGVIALYQDQSEYSEGQMSLSAIFKDPQARKQILQTAKKFGVAVDLEQSVDDNYVDRAIRGEHYGQIQGVAEGSTDTIYPNAEVIKSKNGRPVGEIYQDGNSWGCFHYRADRGYDMIDSRADAIQALKDLHQETGRSGPDYTFKGVAEGLDAETYKQKLLSSLPVMMKFFEKNVQGWRPSREQMLAAIETGYTVMKHTGDVKQAGRAVMDELNTLHRMSQGEQGVAEAQLAEKCWDTHRQAGMKKKGNRMVPNCVPKESSK